jgi:hypothetical protein
VQVRFGALDDGFPGNLRDVMFEADLEKSRSAFVLLQWGLIYRKYLGYSA